MFAFSKYLELRGTAIGDAKKNPNQMSFFFFGKKKFGRRVVGMEKEISCK
jgi:hypothetical protein